MIRSDYYLYVYFRPWNAEPCYIGKGRGKRWREHLTRASNNHLAKIIAKAGRLGLEVPVVIARSDLSHDQAIAAEIAWIAAIGREAKGGPLVNATDGGEGTPGKIVTPAVRAALSAFHTGLRASPRPATEMRSSH